MGLNTGPTVRDYRAFGEPPVHAKVRLLTMTGTQDAAQGAPGEQAWVKGMGAWDQPYLQVPNPPSEFPLTFVMPEWLIDAIVRDHNAVRELRETLDKVIDRLIWASGAFDTDEKSEAWANYGRPVLNELLALAHAQGAGTEEGAK